MPSWTDDEGRSWFCVCEHGGPDCPKCTGRSARPAHYERLTDNQMHEYGLREQQLDLFERPFLNEFDIYEYGTKPRRRRKKARSFKETKVQSRHVRAIDEEKTTYRKDKHMKITAIRYERVSNLGQFETERVAAEATVDAGDTPSNVLAELKTFVHNELGIESMTAEEIAETERKLERAKRRRGL